MIIRWLINHLTIVVSTIMVVTPVSHSLKLTLVGGESLCPLCRRHGFADYFPTCNCVFYWCLTGLLIIFNQLVFIVLMVDITTIITIQIMV